MSITLAAALRKVCPTLTAELAQEWAAALDGELTRAGLVSSHRRAAFLGQVVEETGEFRDIIENLNYSAPQLCKTWPSRFPTPESAAPFADNPEALANRVYQGRLGNTQPGDGWRFRGGGLIQLTGRCNYEAFGKTVGKTAEEAATWVQTTKEGAVASAVYFWTAHKLNALADAWQITRISEIVNGGDTNLKVRLAYSAEFVRALS